MYLLHFSVLHLASVQPCGELEGAWNLDGPGGVVGAWLRLGADSGFRVQAPQQLLPKSLEGQLTATTEGQE